jgi:hypothetical protein
MARPEAPPQGNRKAIASIAPLPPTAKNPKRQALTRAGLVLFVLTLACELWLVHAIPAGLLDGFTLRETLVASVATLAPIVRNFDKLAPVPLHLQLYLALSICLVLPKAVSVLLWLHADREGAYRQHVVSPLTRTKPGGVSEFIMQPIRDLNPGVAQPTSTPRSFVSALFWSLLILVVTLAIEWAVMNTGWQVAAGKSASLEATLIVGGGFDLWLTWSACYMSFIGVIMAVQICIVRDYGVFLWIFTKRLGGLK